LDQNLKISEDRINSVESTSSIDAIKEYQNKLKFNYIELEMKKNFLEQLKTAHENLPELNEEMTQQLAEEVKNAKMPMKEQREQRKRIKQEADHKITNVVNCKFNFNCYIQF
jgi:hypothetical protein